MFLKLTKPNKDNFDDLLVSIEANKNQLNLLIAVCDDSELQNNVIQQYSKDLYSGLLGYKIQLSPKQPSLTFALRKLVKDNPQLKAVDNALITVTGTEKFELLSCVSPSNQSELEELLGYLQWTREALREFPFSIVFWMKSDIKWLVEYKAPDFWSWRKGVFIFK